MEATISESKTSFFGKPGLINIIVGLILLAGFGVRMLDLTNLPLDFHPTRQLYSAIKARGMYYQYAANVPEWKRQIAVQLWKEETPYEPPVLETIVAGTYLVFGEHLWIARIYSSIFWILGGLALFGLARRLSSADGAIIALLYYVFLNFAVIASRSFQPDPLMVALILGSLWAFYCWHDSNTWKWAAIAGLLTGAAIFVKTWAAFPLFGAFAATILWGRGPKKSIKDTQMWGLAILAALPISIYLVDGYLFQKFLATQTAFRFFPALWATGSFYVRWLNMINNIVGSGAFLLALLGIFLARPADRPFLMGMYVGYIAYGFTLPYHIITHTYYQLPLIAIVALSLALPAGALFEKFAEFGQASALVRYSVIAILLLGIGQAVWNVRVYFATRDSRSDAQYWAMLGDKLGHTSSVISLTNDYGDSLAYWGFQDSTYWLRSGDITIRELTGMNVNSISAFDASIAGKQYFIITPLGLYENDEQLKSDLSKYAIYDQSSDYIIFDLQHPLK